MDSPYLLSQWRSYSSLGKGVSLGFNPNYILQCAKSQSFQVSRCIYEPADQLNLIKQVVDTIEVLAEKYGENADKVKRQPSQSYYDIFEKIESDLLRIAAILKHPSLQEEEEWRIVSPVITDYVLSPVLFREGTSMLVPYFEFKLTLGQHESIIEPLIDNYTLGRLVNHNFMIYMTNTNLTISRV